MEQDCTDAAEVVTEEIVTETCELAESAPGIVTEAVAPLQPNLSPREPAKATKMAAMSTTPMEQRTTAFVALTPTDYASAATGSCTAAVSLMYSDTTSTVFTESTPGTLMESVPTNLTEGTQTSFMETAQPFVDPVTSAYTESRLEEAELIINLSSRNRRALSNPTLTQVNTSIAGSVNFAPSLPDTATNISMAETFATTMQNLGDTTASIEVQTEAEVVDAVGSNEHDPLLEENTVAIMGQVTSSSTGLISENTDTASAGNDVTVIDDELNPNNVIVISVIDEEEEQKKRPTGGVKPSSFSCEKVVQQGQYVDGSPETQPPVPTGIVINKHKIHSPEQPEITIERKKIHECIVCKAEFKSIMDLFRHRVEHNENMKTMFKCEVTPACQLMFEDPLELEKHKLMHTEQKVFKCSICQDTFTLLHNYKCHLRIHTNQGPYVCNMCYRVFDKKCQFISHMDDHEFASMNPYRHRLQCNVCDKIFTDSAKLKRHNLIHSGKREFKCNICSKEFFERPKLNRHMLSHTGKREFQCTVCNKWFGLKHNLTIHMRIHDNLRPYQCLVCKRTFIQKIVLQRHLRIHQDYLMEQSQKFSQKYVN